MFFTWAGFQNLLLRRNVFKKGGFKLQTWVIAPQGCGSTSGFFLTVGSGAGNFLVDRIRVRVNFIRIRRHQTMLPMIYQLYRLLYVPNLVFLDGRIRFCLEGRVRIRNSGYECFQYLSQLYFECFPANSFTLIHMGSHLRMFFSHKTNFFSNKWICVKGISISKLVLVFVQCILILVLLW